MEPIIEELLDPVHEGISPRKAEALRVLDKELQALRELQKRVFRGEAELPKADLEFALKIDGRKLAAIILQAIPEVLRFEGRRCG